MKTKHLLCLLTLLFTLSCASNQKKVRAINSHESAQDQYWNNLVKESIEAKTSILNVIQENNLNLYEQITKDAKDPYLPVMWGQSLNFDSGAKEKIVEDRIIGDLQMLFNIQNDNKIVHAGVMHTYGYLFSTIDTPYGYKRKRWIDSAVNQGFGLTGNSLSPDTIDGGLLSNVTYFAGSIAFKNKSNLNLLKNVSNEVFTFNYQGLKTTRLEEVIANYTLVTTFIPFTNSPKDYLLIYSVMNRVENTEQLITVFPVNEDTFTKTTASESLGANQKITLRYNAYLMGLPKELKGERKIIKN